jgi:5-methylcytosine-specific restriction endonuclease McrA
MTALAGRGRPWSRLRARVIAEEQTCGICGRPVDKSLPHPHPASAQVDHIVPVSLAPELVTVRSNLRLVHRACNLRRGIGHRGVQAAERSPRPVFGPLSNASRQW